MAEKGVDAVEKTVKYRGWMAMPYVIGNETCEKLGTLGTSLNMLVYLTSVFHMRSTTATVALSVWQGTTNIATVVGAFLSDAYFGRYATLGFASVSSFLGSTILALTAASPALHPRKCKNTGVVGSSPCEGPTPWQLATLVLGLGLMVVGAGGIRPCNLAFGADQFDPNTEAGKKGINSFFNWYYFTFTTAMMISATVIIYVQSSISWAIGLAIPATLMFLSCIFFFVGTPIYVRVRPEGSPFTSVARVVVAAFKKRQLNLPKGPAAAAAAALYNPPPPKGSLNSRLPHTDQFRFLDKAAVVTSSEDVAGPDVSPMNPWRLCSMQQVEEVKCLVRLIPVWIAGSIYFMCQFQQSNYVVFQALQSDRRLGSSGFRIPAGTFGAVFGMLALTIWIPLYDRIVVPWARRFTGNPGGITILQRMGTGIALSVVSLGISAILEVKRRETALHHPPAGIAGNGSAISSMSALWFIGPLALAGVSEGFFIIGQIELYYKQFPESMRSVAGCAPFCAMAISYYTGGLMVSVVHRSTGGKGAYNWLADDLNEGRLDYYFYLVTALALANFFYFLMVSRWYRYKVVDHDAGSVALTEETAQK